MRRAISLSLLSSLAFAVLSATAPAAHALPPGAAERGLREGANHRLGDDSFVALVGRPPDESDGEAVRMRTHLVYVRALLGDRPAPRAELAPARARMLGYLDEYIAKGTTPINTRLAWRSPVFIDERGAICAVGYLIERSAGRALAEEIAAAHRHDFLEDIAAAMPEVRAWVDASGLALEELASIQPGYDGVEKPEAEQWIPGHLAGVDAEYLEGRREHGAIRRGQMHGAWTKRAEGTREGAGEGDGEGEGEEVPGPVIGAGRLVRGSGAWRSTYEDGALLAKGPYEGSHPHGTWRFYHHSGNLAAEGTFDHGWRHGAWTFFYDSKAKTPISRGRFDRNAFVGRWEHFDEAGRLLAAVHRDAPDTWNGEDAYLVTVLSGEDKVRYQAHLGNRGDLHTYASASLRIYIWDPEGMDTDEEIFDVEGRQLVRREDGGWEAYPCQWTKREKRAARTGDVGLLHGLLARRGESGALIERTCDAAVPLAADTATQVEALLASRERVRAPVPAFVSDFAGDDVRGQRYRDLTDVLTDYVGGYIVWPHINDLFVRVQHTLPNQRPWMGNG